jgi:hypothetical protein
MSFAAKAGVLGDSKRLWCDVLKDPDLLAEVNKGNLEIECVSREEIDGVVQGLYKIERPFVAPMKQLLVP